MAHSAQVEPFSSDSIANKLNDRGSLSSIRLYADLWTHVDQDMHCEHMVCVLLPLLSFIIFGCRGVGGVFLTQNPLGKTEVFIRNMLSWEADWWAYFCNTSWAIGTPPVCRCPEGPVVPRKENVEQMKKKKKNMSKNLKPQAITFTITSALWKYLESVIKKGRRERNNGARLCCRSSRWFEVGVFVESTDIFKIKDKDKIRNIYHSWWLNVQHWKLRKLSSAGKRKERMEERFRKMKITTTKIMGQTYFVKIMRCWFKIIKKSLDWLRKSWLTIS